MRNNRGSDPNGISLGSSKNRSNTIDHHDAHARPVSISKQRSMFDFSFSPSISRNESPSMISNADGAGGISKIDAARVNAPFVMGTSIQQSVPTICINKDGDRTAKNITKHEFAKQIGVHIRDLRIVEMSPANRVEAAINPRANTIILSIERMKMAIFHDEVVIFCPDEEIVPKFISALQHHIATHGPTEHSDDEDDVDEDGYPVAKRSRFEHAVLETVFACACSDINEMLLQLSEDLATVFKAFDNEEELAPRDKIARDHLQDIDAILNVEKAKRIDKKKSARKIKDMIRKSEMSPIKSKLQKLRKKASEISRVLLILLEEDELFMRLFLRDTTVSTATGRQSLALSRQSLEGLSLRPSMGTNSARFTNPLGASSNDGQPNPLLNSHNSGAYSQVLAAHAAQQEKHQQQYSTPVFPTRDFNAASTVNRDIGAIRAMRRGSTVQRRGSVIPGVLLQSMPQVNFPEPSLQEEIVTGFNPMQQQNTSRISGSKNANMGINTTAAENEKSHTPDVPSPTNKVQFSSDTNTTNTRISTKLAQQPMVSLQPVPSDQVISAEEIQNLELILDNFISQFNWISSEIDDLMDQLGNAEVNAALQLDIVRNRIMRYEVYMSMLTIAIALPALVTGIFGMNLEFPKHLYDDLQPFYWTVSLIATSIPLVFVMLFWFGSQRGIF